MQTQETILDNFEEAIKEELCTLNGIKLGEQTNDWWTNSVKNKVAVAVRNKNEVYKIYASGCNEGIADGPEWLYDLTCREENDYLKNIPLVLESEWGKQTDIVYDFKKLVVARADHRIMVFSVKSNKNENWNNKKEEMIKNLLKHVNNFKHSKIGDRYMFACWNEDKEEDIGRQFHFSVYVVC